MDRSFVIGGISFVATAALLAIPTFAQADRGAPAEAMTRAEVEARIAERFAAADADSDGRITAAERDAHRAAAREDRMADIFARLDADGNGEISVAEHEARRDARREHRAERRADRRAMRRESRDMRGSMSVEELAAMAERRAARTPEERDARWADRAEREAAAWTAADADGDGALDRTEFAALAEARHERRAGDEGHGRHRGMRHGAMFERADSDGDGAVTLAEATGPALEMFDRADADRDGTVTAEERRAAWRAIRAERRGGESN